MKLLPNRLAQARKNVGITQRQLAEAVGVTVQAVSQWENGKTDATPRLRTIAQALQCSEQYLISSEVAINADSSIINDKSEIVSVDVLYLEDLPFYMSSNVIGKKDYVRDKIAIYPYGRKGLYAIEVRKSSEKFQVGDVLIFDNELEPEKGDIAAFLSLDPDYKNYLIMSSGSLKFDSAGAIIAFLPEAGWVNSSITIIDIDGPPKEGADGGALIIAGTMIEKRSFRRSAKAT